MKVALVGYGRMGRMVDKLASAKGHQIIARVSSHSSLDWDAVSQADVCIEFSQPDAVLKNLSKISKLGVNCVVGTTGWYDQLETIRTLTTKHATGILYSPNFSIGIHLFLEIVQQAAKRISFFPNYAAAGVEYHHQQKLDSPSGTAKKIAAAINQEMPEAPPLTFSSVRCGSFPGTHTVIFDSPIDTLTFTHAARNREGFAEGAILAGEWLLGKKGLFTLEDCLQEKVRCH